MSAFDVSTHPPKGNPNGNIHEMKVCSLEKQLGSRIPSVATTRRLMITYSKRGVEIYP